MRIPHSPVSLMNARQHSDWPFDPEERPDAMTNNSLDMRFAAACAIAREAGVLARKRFLERPRSQRPDFKGPQDFLTATDAEVEELIRRRLGELFPNDSFFGEE